MSHSTPAARRGLRARIVKRTREAALLARHRANQLRHLHRRPPLSSIGRHIRAELRREGVAAVPLDELPLASNHAVRSAMSRACDYLDRTAAREVHALEYDDGFEHCIPINPSVIAAEFPALFMWGLDESLLDIIENCLGMDTAYHGVCVRKELVDGKHIGTRLWHLDSEDIDVIRVMIYLTDVLDDASGPFEYVPRHSSPSYRDFRGVEAITDDVMQRVVPAWRWRRIKGHKGTVIFSAVTKLFHHGKVPMSARKMASFYYTSRHPTNERLCRTFSFEAGIPHLYEPLTDRQRACLWRYQDLLPRVDDRPARPAGDGPTAPPAEEAVAPAPRPAVAQLPSEAAAPAAFALAGTELT